MRVWYRRVYAHCRSRLGSVADSEDASQEVFLRAFGRLETLRQPDAVGGWLRRIAQNVCIDMIRRSNTRQTNPLRDDPAEPNGDADSVVDRDEQAYVMKLVDSLPQTHREIVLLHYYDNLTYDEIASWLGVARPTVSLRLSEARRTLRSQLVGSEGHL